MRLPPEFSSLVTAITELRSRISRGRNDRNRCGRR
jgi:hypothetical protein